MLNPSGEGGAGPPPLPYGYISPAQAPSRTHPLTAGREEEKERQEAKKLQEEKEEILEQERRRKEIIMKANENEKQRGLKRAEVREKQLGCFNGEARVLLADGSVKEAHQVHAGDCIACDIDCATSAVVIGRYVQSAGVRREVLRLCSGRLAISNSHRVKLCGRWMTPGDAADAEREAPSVVHCTTSFWMDVNPLLSREWWFPQ